MQDKALPGCLQDHPAGDPTPISCGAAPRHARPAGRFFRQPLYVLAASLGLAVAAPTLACAQEDDGPKGPTMHQLATTPPVPSAHKDFSQFQYRPAGDKVIEQSDANRLLFWTPQGTPDGYAERRGNAIFYYDRTGKAIRVQELPFDEN